jgi:predicted RNA-binding protein
VEGVLLSKPLFDKVVGYVTARPYSEVQGLMEDIKQSAQLVNVPDNELQDEAVEEVKDDGKF